jgi:sulfoacetaldehyde dehydrogenase
VIAVEAIADALVAALAREGGVRLDREETDRLREVMFADGKLSPAVVAQSASTIAGLAGLVRPDVASARFLIVDEDGVGAAHPFSGEKLSPVLAIYRARDFDAAAARAGELLGYQGAGHSVGLHTRKPERATHLVLALPVCRVIVKQAHCFATCGAWDN